MKHYTSVLLWVGVFVIFAIADAHGQQSCAISAFTGAAVGSTISIYFTESASVNYDWLDRGGGDLVSVHYSDQGEGSGTLVYLGIQSDGIARWRIQSTLTGTGHVHYTDSITFSGGVTDTQNVSADGSIVPGVNIGGDGVQLQVDPKSCTYLIGLSYGVPGTLTEGSFSESGVFSGGAMPNDSFNYDFANSIDGPCSKFSPLAFSSPYLLSVNSDQISGSITCHLVDPFFFTLPVGTETISWSTSPLSTTCVDKNTVAPHADRPYSQDLYPTTMNASFTPTMNRVPVSLSAAEAACGFTGFDWQQTVTSAPPPLPLPVWTLNGTPPVAPFSDPPPGGYANLQIPPFLDAYPFYYNPIYVVPTECIIKQGNLCLEFATSGDTLNFFDQPLDPCLPGGPNTNQANCSFSTAPPGSYLGFRTALVGVLPSNKLGPELYHWTWRTTFNGISGGIATNTVSSGATGTGGVTITSINDVPQSPPSATCAAAPNLLWPPNGKSVPVTISGNITAGTSGLVTTTYSVRDEYGQVQPSGTITLAQAGNYSFTTSLIAARDGKDLNGRTYTVSVRGEDTVGNVGVCSVVVTVPHDQS